MRTTVPTSSDGLVARGRLFCGLRRVDWRGSTPRSPRPSLQSERKAGIAVARRQQRSDIQTPGQHDPTVRGRRSPNGASWSQRSLTRAAPSSAPAGRERCLRALRAGLSRSRTALIATAGDSRVARLWHAEVRRRPAKPRTQPSTCMFTVGAGGIEPPASAL